MKVIKTKFVDIPISLFKIAYGIGIDDALDICEERKKVIVPMFEKRIVIKNVTTGKESTGEGNLCVTVPYIAVLSDIMIKNDKIVSLKEQEIEID